MSQFRPIGLCNVTYKIISKVIVKTLKPHLPGLINQTQSSFISGRNISDNIIIAQEVIHSMHLKKGKKGFMAIKVDLEKAYDRLRWSFILDTLQEIGLPRMMIALIMDCITTVSMRVLWNGNMTDEFTPQRGIRQGDPISPYIFVLCIERLAQRISKLVDEKVWKPLFFKKNDTYVSHLFFADDMLLIAKANAKHAMLIKKILDRFALDSGQKVSINKTKILFSNNIPQHKQTRISRIMGYTKTNDLGRYLGMPLIKGRVTRKTYEDIIQKMDKRLNGWKVDRLSLAGRVTLAKSVLATIPSYVMQTTKLPVNTCEEIDKRVRNFVWGSSINKRRAHLVKWNVLCKQKSEGGLGFRRSRDQNKASLMKLAFGVLTKPQDLWVRVLRAKYCEEMEGHLLFKRKSNLSYTWRGIRGVWDDMREGVRWMVGNGQKCRFWIDCWLDDGCVLINEVNQGVWGGKEDTRIAEYVQPDGNWNWTKLEGIPAHIKVMLEAIKPPTNNEGEDKAVWGFTPQGKFTTNSAYNLLIPSSDLNCRLWEEIWAWNGPQRVKLFLWLCANDALLTNKRRAGMQLCDSSYCSRCNLQEETTIHVLRDCIHARGIWEQVVPYPCWSRFFSLPLIDFIMAGCRNEFGMEHGATMFGVATWMIWKRRNEAIFHGENAIAEGPIHVLRNFITQVKFAEGIEGVTCPKQRGTEQTENWTKPDKGWYKINVDGARCRVSGKAATGGLIRDEFGFWVGGFQAALGTVNSATAELKAVLFGLRLAWEKRLRKIIVESDSTQVCTLLTSNIDDSECSTLHQIRLLMAQNWEIKIMQIDRRCNGCADLLAKDALSSDISFKTLNFIPSILNTMYYMNIMGSNCKN